MVSVLSCSAVDHGFVPRLCQVEGYVIGICCFYAKHEEVRAKTGWLGILIMYLSWMPFLTISEQALCRIQKYVGLVQSRHYHHRIEMQLLTIIYLKNLSFGIKRTITHKRESSIRPFLNICTLGIFQMRKAYVGGREKHLSKLIYKCNYYIIVYLLRFPVKSAPGQIVPGQIGLKMKVKSATYFKLNKNYVLPVI